jgi:hypothetical protein
MYEPRALSACGVGPRKTTKSNSGKFTFGKLRTGIGGWDANGTFNKKADNQEATGQIRRNCGEGIQNKVTGKGKRQKRTQRQSQFLKADSGLCGKKFASCFGTRKFIVVFASVYPLRKLSGAS